MRDRDEIELLNNIDKWRYSCCLPTYLLAFYFFPFLISNVDMAKGNQCEKFETTANARQCGSHEDDTLSTEPIERPGIL